MITSSRGLVTPETIVTLEELRKISAVPIVASDSEVPRAAGTRCSKACVTGWRGLRDCPARQHRIAEICGTFARSFWGKTGVSIGICRARRYEPRRPDAPMRARRNAADVRSRSDSGSPRSTTRQVAKALPA